MSLMRLRTRFRSYRRCATSLPGLVFLVLATSLVVKTAHADSWALLIGIDQYSDSNRITSLGGAAADARALAKTLREAAGFPESHIQLLVSDGDATTRPTRVEILNALTRLAANAKEGDTVFVLYSGHGIEIDGTSYLLPYDTSALSDADITDSALETDKFTSRLRKIKARALVLAFDMCRSDPRKGSRALGGNSDNKLTKSTVRGLDFSSTAAGSVAANSTKPAGSPIAITFYSCSPDERSYEDRLQSRGYFSEFLEKGLRGAAADASGTVRVAGLAKYLEKNVHAAVSESENGASQTPYPEMKGPGVGEFALSHRTGPATASVAAAPAAAAIAAPTSASPTSAPATSAPATSVPATTHGAFAVPPPAAPSNKVVLRYRAQVGQTERRHVNAILLQAGTNARMDVQEVHKLSYVQIDPASGELAILDDTEKVNRTVMGRTQSMDHPLTVTYTIRPNGQMTGVKSERGTREDAANQARIHQASILCFSDKPVGPGDKWSYDYKEDRNIGTRDAHADFEVLAAATINSVKRSRLQWLTRNGATHRFRAAAQLLSMLIPAIFSSPMGNYTASTWAPWSETERCMWNGTKAALRCGDRSAAG